MTKQPTRPHDSAWLSKLILDIATRKSTLAGQRRNYEERPATALSAIAGFERPPWVDSGLHWERGGKFRLIVIRAETTQQSPRPCAPFPDPVGHTPSVRVAKSAASNTFDLTKSNTLRPTVGLSGSIKSKMNFDDLSLPSCMMLFTTRLGVKESRHRKTRVLSDLRAN
jgi:hypothetical protein